MTLFLTILGASALGTFIANLGVFWVIGALAQRQQKRQEAELARLQQGYLEMAQRERERIDRYAKMES